MKRAVALAIMFMLLLTGCSKENPQEALQEQSEKNTIRIGITFDTFVVERWQRDRDVFVSTALELGAEVNVQNANGNVEEQVAQMEYFIEKKMDVIVVVPIESGALAKSIKKAKEEGIRVVSYDRLVIGGGTDLYVSFDNETVGSLMGQAVSSRLKEGDKVLMICGPNSDNNVSLVERGFRREMAKSKIEIADIYYAEEWRAERAAEYMEQYGERIEDIQAVMCGNDHLAGQVVRILAEKRMAGDVCVVAQDADLEACQRIVEGTQYMTVYKPVEKLAVQAAVAAVELAQGKKVETRDFIDDGEYQVPYIKLDPIAVTDENMDETIIKGGFHLAEEVYLNRPELLDRQ